jgi:hypothetical protein
MNLLARVFVEKILTLKLLSKLFFSDWSLPIFYNRKPIKYTKSYLIARITKISPLLHYLTFDRLNIQ